MRVTNRGAQHATLASLRSARDRCIRRGGARRGRRGGARRRPSERSDRRHGHRPHQSPTPGRVEQHRDLRYHARRRHRHLRHRCRGRRRRRSRCTGTATRCTARARAYCCAKRVAGVQVFDTTLRDAMYRNDERLTLGNAVEAPRAAVRIDHDLVANNNSFNGGAVDAKVGGRCRLPVRRQREGRRR